MLGAKAAVLSTDAGFDGTDRLTIGVTGDHARRIEISPDIGQVFLADTKQIDTLAASDLDGRHVVFFSRISNGAQLGRRCQTAPHTWHDRVGAIFLDIGVCPLVDEARLGIVFGLVRKTRDQVIVNGRAALVATVGRFPAHVGKDGFFTDEMTLHDGFAYSFMRLISTAAYWLRILGGRCISAADR